MGADQYNFVVPANVRQGCTVPLQIQNSNLSGPVTISIASGGGACVDPPTQGYGEVLWEKLITTPASSSSTPTGSDTLTVSLQASPGKQAPTPPVFAEGTSSIRAITYFGPGCPVPGYRSLAAGTVTVSGPGLATVAAQPAPLPSSTVFNISLNGLTTAQVQSAQVSGLTEYKATLPAGTIQAGSFTVTASGGADTGSFQSSVQIGSPIEVTTALAGITLHSQGPPFTINWTGGDSNSWVTLKLLGHYGPFDSYPFEWLAHASDGEITIQGEGQLGFAIGGPVDIVMEVVPDPSMVPTFAATGLSLGGKALWKYIYVFQGALVEP